MNIRHRLANPIFPILLLGVGVFFLYYFLATPRSLFFSDSAKMAQSSKNLTTSGNTYVSHSFFNSNILTDYSGAGFATDTLPLNIQILSSVFRWLPQSDQTVALVGFIFYLTCSALVYFLTLKLFDPKTAVVASLFFICNPFMLEYAANFSTEITFTLEILLFCTLLAFGKRLLALVPLAAMFLTRPQSLSFAVGALMASGWLYVFQPHPNKKRLFQVATITTIVVVFFLVKTRGNLATALGSYAGSVRMDSSVQPGAYLRGAKFNNKGAKALVSKTAYNIYNFAKTPARLMPENIFLLGILGAFAAKMRHQRWFTCLTIFTLVTLLISASVTLPNARYVHPVTPLVIVLAASGLTKLSQIIAKSHQGLLVILATVFILLPQLGHLTVDSRYRLNQYNFGRPTAYQEISSLMAHDIAVGKLTITNLDAWAAWYKGLTTMWFPLYIQQLEGHEDSVDYIAITDYKSEDGDFNLSPEWRNLLEKPENLENNFIASHYTQIRNYLIPAKSIFENQDMRLVIYKRNVLQTN